MFKSCVYNKMAAHGSIRSGLLSAVTKGSVRGWFAQHADTNPDYGSLAASIDLQHKSQLFDVLALDLQDAIATVSSGAAAEEKLGDALNFLRSAASFMGHFCQTDKQEVPNSYFIALNVAASILTSVSLDTKQHKACANEVSKLIERIFLLGRPEGQLPAISALHHLLLEVAVDPSETALKRLYAIRAAVATIDLSDPASAPWRGHILGCISSKPVLSSAMGRKLTAHLMTLDPGLPKDMYKEVKGMFSAQSMPSVQLQGWIGEVFLRAWEEAGKVVEGSTTQAPAGGGAGTGGGTGEGSKGKKGRKQAAVEDDADGDAAPTSTPDLSVSVPPFRARIEEDVYQNIVYDALHTARGELFAAWLRFIEVFAGARAGPGASTTKAPTKGIDAALVRIADSCLWSGFKAVNPVVRLNAARILESVCLMGLACTEAEAGGKGERKKIVQKQVTTYSELLNDSSPAVREVAVRAVAALLNAHWGELNMTVRDHFLSEIVDKAGDRTSPGVRAASVSAIESILLEHVECHHALLAKGHLDTLSHLISDRDAAVRLAVLSMLEAMEGFKGSFKHSWYFLHSSTLASEAAAEGGSGVGSSAGTSATPPMVQQLMAYLVLNGEDKKFGLAASKLLAKFFFPSMEDAEEEGSSEEKNAGKGKGSGKGGKESYTTQQKLMVLLPAAEKRVKDGLNTYEHAVLAFLRHVPGLPDSCLGGIGKSLLGLLAASLWEEADKMVRKAADLLSTLAEMEGPAGENEAPAGEEDEVEGDDGFVRRHGGAAGGGNKKRGRAGKAKGTSKVADKGPQTIAKAYALSLKAYTVFHASMMLWEGLCEAIPSLAHSRTPPPAAPAAAAGGKKGGKKGAGAVARPSEEEGSPETGGISAEYMTEADAIRHGLASVITVDSVAALLRRCTTAVVPAQLAHVVTAEEATDAASKFMAVRRGLRSLLFNVAGRLPTLHATASTRQASTGGVEEVTEESSLADSLWATLMELTPADVHEPFSVPACVPVASVEGDVMLQHLVRCMVGLGRGEALLQVALHSVQACVQVCSDSMSGEPVPLPGSSKKGGQVSSANATEEHLLAAIRSKAQGSAQAAGIPYSGVPHPLLSHPILELLLVASAAISPHSAEAQPAPEVADLLPPFDSTLTLDSQRVQAILNTLASGMSSIVPVLRAGPAACGTAPALLLCRLAALSAPCWAAIDSKALIARSGAKYMQPMRADAMDLASSHLSDACRWLIDELLPCVLAHTWAAKDCRRLSVSLVDEEQGAVAASIRQGTEYRHGYALALASAYSITSCLLSMASDMTSSGLAADAALSLLTALTEDSMGSVQEDIPGLEAFLQAQRLARGLPADAPLTTSIMTPLAWLTTGTEAFLPDTSAPGMEAEGEDSVDVEALTLLRKAMVQCHSCALKLGVDLWTLACMRPFFSLDTGVRDEVGAGQGHGAQQLLQYPYDRHQLSAPQLASLCASLSSLLTQGPAVRVITSDEESGGAVVEEQDRARAAHAYAQALTHSYPAAVVKVLYQRLCDLVRGPVGEDSSSAAGRARESDACTALDVLLSSLHARAHTMVRREAIRALCAGQVELKGGSSWVVSAYSMSYPALSSLLDCACARTWSSRRVMTILRTLCTTTIGGTTSIPTGSAAEEELAATLLPLAYAVQRVPLHGIASRGKGGALVVSKHEEAVVEGRAVLQQVALALQQWAAQEPEAKEKGKQGKRQASSATGSLQSSLYAILAAAPVPAG